MRYVSFYNNCEKVLMFEIFFIKTPMLHKTLILFHNYYKKVITPNSYFSDIGLTIVKLKNLFLIWCYLLNLVIHCICQLIYFYDKIYFLKMHVLYLIVTHQQVIKFYLKPWLLRLVQNHWVEIP